LIWIWIGIGIWIWIGIGIWIWIGIGIWIWIGIEPQQVWVALPETLIWNDGLRSVGEVLEFYAQPSPCDLSLIFLSKQYLRTFSAHALLDGFALHGLGHLRRTHDIPPYTMYRATPVAHQLFSSVSLYPGSTAPSHTASTAPESQHDQDIHPPHHLLLYQSPPHHPTHDTHYWHRSFVASYPVSFAI
jgi:hypothetical protein